jgi:hypothetical protein
VPTAIGNNISGWNLLCVDPSPRGSQIYLSWRTSFSNSFATAFVMSAGLGSHLMGPEEMVDPFAHLRGSAIISSASAPLRHARSGVLAN